MSSLGFASVLNSRLHCVVFDRFSPGGVGGGVGLIIISF